MRSKEIETFYPSCKQEWRQWLEKNHILKQSIWLVCYKKKANIPTISWSDAVDEALCFGWIDSTRVSLDNDMFRHFFCKRKPKSVWSKINKEKVERLIEAGLMTEAGFKSIEIAKQNGTWNILDEVEELKVPEDLLVELKNKPGAENYFLSLSKSKRKMILQWLVMAKRPETRQKRIKEVAELASQEKKPKPFW